MFLGESKQGYYDREVYQYQFNCPSCRDDNGGIPDNKYNLEVLLSETQGLKFKCWKCSETNSMKGPLWLLVKRYGGLELYAQYKECVQDILNSKLYQLDGVNSGITESIKVDVELKLPKTVKNIDLKTCKYQPLINYLNKRKIDQKTIDKYNIGYTINNRDEKFQWRNRLIIPSYDCFGDLNYYIGRDYLDRDSKYKYMNSKVDKTDVVFQDSLVDYDSPIYLCEGVFDAMRFPFNGISMLGKTLSKDSLLYQTLYKKANSTITIVLDGDTNILETKKIYILLDFGRLHNKIRYIDMANDCKYKDVSELFENEGEKGIIQLLSKQKKFEEIDLIF